MKIIQKWLKTQEQKSKLQLISELLVSGTVEDNVKLFNDVKANFRYKMEVHKLELENDIKIINKIRVTKKEYDPNLDKKLAELEFSYELVKPE